MRRRRADHVCAHECCLPRSTWRVCASVPCQTYIRPSALLHALAHSSPPASAQPTAHPSFRPAAACRVDVRIVRSCAQRCTGDLSLSLSLSLSPTPTPPRRFPLCVERDARAACMFRCHVRHDPCTPRCTFAALIHMVRYAGCMKRVVTSDLGTPHTASHPPSPPHTCTHPPTPPALSAHTWRVCCDLGCHSRTVISRQQPMVEPPPPPHHHHIHYTYTLIHTVIDHATPPPPSPETLLLAWTLPSTTFH